MAITINHQTNDISATSGSLTIDGSAPGGGFYKGDRGSVGDATGASDIFRVNSQALNTNVTIDSDENASCAGPLTLATGVTLTVNGNLTVV